MANRAHLRYALLALLAIHHRAAAQPSANDDDLNNLDDDDDPNAKQRQISAQYSYCKEENCYEVLGVKRTSPAFAIKRAYRRLAAAYHPDKNPSPRAKEKFNRYTNAYEVVADSEMRKNYEYFLDHPFEFPGHYMRYGSGKYAPKTDVRVVLFLVVAALSVAQYFFKDRQRKDMRTAAINSRKYDELCRSKLASLAGSAGGKSPQRSNKRGGGSGVKNVSDELIQRAEALVLEEIERELPPMPTVSDTVAWKVFSLPVSGSRALAWFLKFSVLGQPYGEAEKEYLTAKAVGRAWDEADEEERAEMMALKLWENEEAEAYAAPKLKGYKKKRAAAEAASHRLGNMGD